jgi:Icc-related predicted phosphoesterase
MRLHVVSDVHGSVEALARAGDGADALVCLGDLVLFVDYADPSRGIFPDLFGPANTRRWVELRDSGRYDEARRFTRPLWESLGPDPRTVITEAVRAQYAALFAAMPTPAYVTYGNVDLPELWPEFLRDGIMLLDGATTEIDGLTFGFVGGGLPTPKGTPYEVPEDTYNAKVTAVGAVDVLCAHIPPALPQLTYDVVARGFERGSEAILEAVRVTQPRAMLYGHVHQPLYARTRVGRTECVNVGHFRGTGRPYLLRW